MIVISGALVLVALVLLVIGLVSSALGFVYASIAVSVVSFAFLIVGILQRRGEPLPEAAEAAPAISTSSDVEGVTAIIPAASRSRPATEEPAAVDAAPAVSGRVLVVAGRPRYHVAGCRYLTGKEAEDIPVAEAREEGYSACGVCKPDEALAGRAAEEPELVAAPVAAARSRKAPAKTPARAAATKTTTKAPGKTGPSKAPATVAKAPARKVAVQAPAAAAKKAAPAAKAAAAKKAAAGEGRQERRPRKPAPGRLASGQRTAAVPGEGRRPLGEGSARVATALPRGSHVPSARWSGTGRAAAAAPSTASLLRS